MEYLLFFSVIEVCRTQEATCLGMMEASEVFRNGVQLGVEGMPICDSILCEIHKSRMNRLSRALQL